MIAYRPIALQDYSAAMALWNATPGVRATESPEMFARILIRNPDLGCVAVDDNHLVGAVLCGHDGRRGYLYHLAVAESHRKLGIATKLVRWCLAGLQREGIEKCSIFLFTDNEPGRAFWSRIGWRERIDLRVMAKELSSA